MTKAMPEMAMASVQSESGLEKDPSTYIGSTWNAVIPVKCKTAIASVRTTAMTLLPLRMPKCSAADERPTERTIEATR